MLGERGGGGGATGATTYRMQGISAPLCEDNTPALRGTAMYGFMLSTRHHQVMVLNPARSVRP